jgi:hypothetical protein
MRHASIAVPAQPSAAASSQRHPSSEVSVRARPEHYFALENFKRPRLSESPVQDSGELDKPEARLRLQRHIEDLVLLYSNEPDPTRRRDLLEEIAQINDAAAVRQLLALAAKEDDSSLQLELLQALSGEEATPQNIGEISPQLSSLYFASNDEELRVAIEDVFERAAAPQSIEFLQQAYADKNALPLERVRAAEAMLRLDTRDDSLLSDSESNNLMNDLRIQAQAADDSPEVRESVVMALAERREENQQFFRAMLASETDAGVRRLLEKLTI